MKRGPEPGRRARGLPSCAALAEASWNGAPPAWVIVLAQICDESTQKGAAEAIGYSAGVVSQVLRNSYPGDLGRIEIKVRGAFMAHTVTCPVLGDIASHDCLDHQRRPFATTNPQRVQLYKACRGGCPHSRIKTGLKGASNAER